MKALDLIATARLLAINPRQGCPPETDLRRAVSTAYYAMFHSLAECCANTIAGGREANRGSDAWLRVYRALEHGTAKRRCDDRAEILKFPAEIRRFATTFSEMQQRRHLADYAPDAAFDREGVLQRINESEGAIRLFDKAPIADRRAFAVHVLVAVRRN